MPICFTPQWQQAIGFCPLVVGVGNPDSGKTKAGNIALATVGGYPHLFFELFTDSHNGLVASKTSMGFQADDPTDPAEIGKAAKRFFSGGDQCLVQTRDNSKVHVYYDSK